MAFADDLLKDAHHLAARGGKNPRQSSLQRAVSTAYYALFHLLIGDFVLNWRRPDQRVRLGRMFDHRKMIQAKLSGAPSNSVEDDLKKVIDAFAQLQEDRHTADYDFGRNWSRVDVTNTLALADEAFIAWRNVRKEKIAQDHVPDNVRGSKDVNRQPNPGNPMAERSCRSALADSREAGSAAPRSAGRHQGCKENTVPAAAPLPLYAVVP
ncbi:MAG: hypothetical protein ACLP59_24780 [Bryobacteraceae bacterium]